MNTGTLFFIRKLGCSNSPSICEVAASCAVTFRVLPKSQHTCLRCCLKYIQRVTLLRSSIQIPQRLVEQFESLVLSAGPGSPEADGATLPRPIGQERCGARAPQQAFDPANCSADNMRPTVMGVPNSTALRLRCVWFLPHSGRAWLLSVRRSHCYLSTATFQVQ
jgi:hypothetical protein